MLNCKVLKTVNYKDWFIDVTYSGWFVAYRTVGSGRYTEVCNILFFDTLKGAKQYIRNK